jgi:malto-oligosyltrehalose trehalohydrolase
MSRQVRDFFIHNALFWLTEYHLDGLRLDAVHAILDDSTPEIVTELAETVRRTLGCDRFLHLILENDNNAAHYLDDRRGGCARMYNAQWNDDIHHALHVALTGEGDGYYVDFVEKPIERLGRCLAEGFDYQGESSVFRGGAMRGEPSRTLPPAAFVSFLQNHDQIGNRAFGERLVQLADTRAIKAAMAILLLAPSPPLLFMGEEFGADTPFLFFCDFGPDLAAAVTEGRRNEFSRFRRFKDPSERSRIPDPNQKSTLERSKLDWASLQDSKHRSWLAFYRDLLNIRREKILPLLANIRKGEAGFDTFGNRGLRVCWRLNGGGELTLLANLGDQELTGGPCPSARALYHTPEETSSALADRIIPAWGVAWFLR